MELSRQSGRGAPAGLFVLVLALLIVAAIAAQALPLLYQPSAGVSGNPPTLQATGVRPDVGPMGDRVVGVGRNLLPARSPGTTSDTWLAFGILAGLLAVVTVATVLSDRRLAQERVALAGTGGPVRELRPEGEAESRRKAA